MGRKITVATSMMKSVSWLDDASHTVRLAPGSSEDGRMNGNIDRPTVEMMPSDRELAGDEGQHVASQPQSERRRPARADEAERRRDIIQG